MIEGLGVAVYYSCSADPSALLFAYHELEDIRGSEGEEKCNSSHWRNIAFHCWVLGPGK